MAKLIDTPGSRYGWAAALIMPGEYFDQATPSTPSVVRVWDGAQWLEKPVKSWTGSEWSVRQVKACVVAGSFPL